MNVNSYIERLAVFIWLAHNQQHVGRKKINWDKVVKAFWADEKGRALAFGAAGVMIEVITADGFLPEGWADSVSMRRAA
tara:strand:+ start:370 stop:606 length:237 start_codon:yes stop_codon:yes gene_type:complete